MPRDLELERQGSKESPQQLSPSQEEEVDAIKRLHPQANLLSLGDLESCVKLEDATFPEHQRCTREKFVYRLTTCGELCLGLFSSAGPDSETRQAATASVATSPDSNSPDRKHVLLAHAIGTKTKNKVIQDGDMKINAHQEDGRTIALHSLAVLPAYQKMGLGKLLLRSYIQRLVDADVADRISIITYDRLVPYYAEGFGFKDMGKSKAEFGGGEWVDMVLEFSDWKAKEGNES